MLDSFDELNIDSIKKFYEFAILPVNTEEDADKVVAKIKLMTEEELQILHMRVHAALENLEIFHACLLGEIKLRTNKELC